ncbi:DUF3560 domain-containing protein [Streptomyces sp. NPDC048696]|uniref:DUF3560 domain-containing protein n=1 Tax=Streptomyces sp. NPDC048696 TaxID=3365585 RepID=UPI00371D8BED
MTIEITHSRREGTLIGGTTRGDGSAEVLKLRHYESGYSQPARWSRNLGCWYLPHSRDKRASKNMLEALAQRLRAAGLTVTVSVNDDDRRTFQEAERERTERAEARAERFSGYADGAASKSQALYDRAHAQASHIPVGQPVLIGHHSERGDRRRRERIHDTFGKSIEENKRASYWSSREQTAARYEEFRNNPPRTLRRIEKLEAQLRRVEKWQKGESAGGFTENIGNPEVVEELRLQHLDLDLTEEIKHWREVIAQAEADGFKVWGKADFTKGDFVKVRGRWYEVMRVNAKTLTVPWTLDPHNRVVTQDNRVDRLGTRTVPYDEVSARKSAQEIAALRSAAS